MAAEEKVTIKLPKLLVVEGKDAYFFCIWALKAFGVDDVQVLDFGGIGDLTKYLKTLTEFPGYDQVNMSTLVIARDAESNPATAIANIKASLHEADFTVPDNPFEFTTGIPRIAFIIFPGFETSTASQNRLSAGTLDDLCLNIVKDTSTFGCVDLYMQCLQSNGEKIPRPHKSKLHSYLSGKDKYVGLKIGEASKAGAWDWTHPKLEKFKDIITNM